MLFSSHLDLHFSGVHSKQTHQGLQAVHRGRPSDADAVCGRGRPGGADVVLFNGSGDLLGLVGNWKEMDEEWRETSGLLVLSEAQTVVVTRKRLLSGSRFSLHLAGHLAGHSPSPKIHRGSD